MPPQPDWAVLRDQASTFAKESVQDVLNRTITDGISITAVLNPQTSHFLVGRGVSKNDLVGQAIPVALGKRTPRCWLGLSHRVELNEHGYLTDLGSSYELRLSAEGEPLLRYDYRREGTKGYPEAHLHVLAEGSGWQQLFDKAGRTEHATLGRLHLPVGGRRFRPSLEDVIEFLVVERFAEARQGWEQVLEQHRRDWYRRQLVAAILRDPLTAKDALAEYVRRNPDADL